MSGVTNEILSFLAEHHVPILAVVVIFILRFLVLRTFASFRKPAVGAFTFDPSSRPKAHDIADGERGRFQSLVDDLKDDNRALRERVSRLSNMNTLLAPLIKELNSNVDRRRLGPLALKVIERIFSPRQALVFFAEHGGTELTLSAESGASGITEGFTCPVGEGFAGVVARKKVMLSRDDLRHESNLVRQKVQEGEPDLLRTDIATPILYRGELLGVICMGGFGDISEDVRALFGMVADMTALALMNYLQYRQIEELANSDPLTRIYNKGYFLEVCDYELNMARRDDRPMSILMIDVDKFKHYNDTNGHLAGDRLLKSLAEILKKEVREKDTVARFGGEEFIILISGVDAEGGERAADRIRTAIEQFPFPNGEKQPMGLLSVSIGVAALPEHGVRMEDIIERADEALYAAKEGGRNRVVRAESKVEVISF